jgi:hypothetical protein
MKTKLKNHKTMEQTSSTQEANQECSHICNSYLLQFKNDKKLTKLLNKTESSINRTQYYTKLLMIQSIQLTYNKEEFKSKKHKAKDKRNCAKTNCNNKTCVLKSYIIKSDLRSPNLRLYLINKNVPTSSTPKLI